MDLNTVFSDSKLAILRELSKGEKSPSELSKNLKTSIANISMQARLLEALGIIEKQKKDASGMGKPRINYSLKKEFAYVTLLKKNQCAKKLIKLEPSDKIIFSAYFLNEPKLLYFLLKFYFAFDEIILGSQGFSFLGSKDDAIEFLILHEKKSELLHRFKDLQYSHQGNSKKIIVNVYTKEEFQKGLQEKNNGFESLISQSYILYDTDDFLFEAKSKNIYSNV